MTLKDLKLKPVYYSDENDLLNDFYIPVLSASKEYNRIAGYFCSNSLAISVKGVSKLIENGGRIRLIANVFLLEEDQIAIKNALNKIQEDLINEIEKIDDELKRDHIKLLGWMVKNRKLEIKIAVVSKGIEHQKIGILKDNEGNIVSFSGSENETLQGWLYNDEQFHVFCSWKEGDLQHLNPDINRFELLWNNKGIKVKVFPISDAFRDGLIKNVPRDDYEFDKISKESLDRLFEENRKLFEICKTKKERGVTLRAYQTEAVTRWKENNFRGIFEMATGVGKTIAAISCLELLSKMKWKLVSIICCPYNHLIAQWKRELKKFNNKDEIIIADGSNKNWKDELADYTNYLNKNLAKRLIVITTYNTFSSNRFIEQIKKFQNELLLIADEMHWSGADTFSKGLIENYNFRLGLSATPERYLDDIGSQLIISYFGGTVFEFDLKRAIKEINPETGKSYLTPYDYHPYFVELEPKEYEDYLIITKKMSRLFRVKKDKHKKEEILQRLAEKRQKIVVNASAKLDVFKEIVKSLDYINHLLVYCSDKQIDTVQKVLGDFEVINHRFTSEEGTTTMVKYEGLSQREFLLKKFADCNYQALVAMKCLDEGVDVPPARKAIILASSGNPKEYIQRRGRILRRYEGKEKADIYDVMVVPSFSGNIPKETKETEKNIILKEIKRYEEFANIADNRLEALNNIFLIKKRYSLA